MKRLFLSVSCLVMALGMITMVSCGNDKGDKKLPKTQVTSPVGHLPNYRFINMDSITLQYNLSVDFNEQMLAMENNLAEEEKRQSNTLNSKGQNLQKRYNDLQQERVPLPSEMDAFQKDYENFQNMHNRAQEKLSKMGMELEQTRYNNLKTIMDSVQSFLKEYSEIHGYDAIFFSHEAPYYNPALDITDEVVEGLNARYNKVKK